MLAASSRRRRWLPVFVLASCLGLGGPGAPPAFGHQAHCASPSPLVESGGGLRLVRVATAFMPTDIASAPGDGRRLYVVQRDGVVRVIVDGRLLDAPFLDLSAEVAPTVSAERNERGMQAIAFAPDYRRSGRVYVFYSDARGDTRVTEFRRSADPNRVSPFRRDVLRVGHALSGVHYGGGMAFGPDGALYVGLGDAEQPGLALRRREPYGKIWRSDLEPGSRWRVAAFGLRNPYRLSFDPANGDMFIGDVGDDAAEEINVIRRSRRSQSRPVLPNFGWPVFEGTVRRIDRRLNQPLRPLVELAHPGSHAVVVGHVVRSGRQSAYRGRLLYGDFCDGSISSVRAGRGSRTPRRELIQVPYLSAFGQDARRRSYVASLVDGGIFRIDGLN